MYALCQRRNSFSIIFSISYFIGFHYGFSPLSILCPLNSMIHFLVYSIIDLALFAQ